MSTAVMGYSPESPRDMSPDTSSPYPDRPIRPLPKKPLRERLSPDVAQSIKYPPAPKTTTPLFYYGYNSRDENGTNDLVEPPHPSERERADDIERNYISRRNGEEQDSDEDEQAYRSRIYSRPSADTPGRPYRYVQKQETKHPNPQAPASIASSADGYDSFENTNNKKKRKIPTPGDSILNGALSNDLASMGISSPGDLTDDTVNGAGYHVSGVGHGISGPGRGRYGRIRSGRSPLRTLSEASSNWGNSRSTKPKQPPQWSPTHESTGIISASIDTARQQYPITPSKGQENISILQEASKKSSPASTQFTFTCETQVPGTVPWPGPSSTTNVNQPLTTAMKKSTATQTSPGGLSVPAVVAKAKQGLAASQAQLPNHHKQNEAAPKPKKTRRQFNRELDLAAQRRREEQRRKNHNSRNTEEQWLCNFCEYQLIFGEPPKALIRQYEIKDRRDIKKALEKQRLLEKAKMKGRKGKKGNKAAPKTAPAVQDRQTQHQSLMNNSQSQSQGTQSEDNYENEDGEEYATQNDPPSPAGPRTAHRTVPVYDGGQVTGVPPVGIPVS